MSEASKRTPEQIKQQVFEFAKALGKYPRNLVRFHVMPEEAEDCISHLMDRRTVCGDDGYPGLFGKEFLQFYGIRLSSQDIEL